MPYRPTVSLILVMAAVVTAVMYFITHNNFLLIATGILLAFAVAVK